jgi:hypothetical protein
MKRFLTQVHKSKQETRLDELTRLVADFVEYVDYPIDGTFNAKKVARLGKRIIKLTKKATHVCLKYGLLDQFNFAQKEEPPFEMLGEPMKEKQLDGRVSFARQNTLQKGAKRARVQASSSVGKNNLLG